MRKKEACILLVDDDRDILFSARMVLTRYFTSILMTVDPRTIRNQLTEQVVDVVLMDMNYRRGFEDGREGLYWLEQIKEISPNTTVILITAYGTVDLAVKALKNGATDFILKPWDNEKLYAVINAGVDLARSSRKTDQLQSVQKKSNADFHSQTEYVIGISPAMQQVVSLIQKVAPTDASVLILGEHGTGKFVFAKEIHRLSNRKDEPFIHVDLGSLSEQLFESELFGYKKGAFTDAKEDSIGRFELARGGTIFLDEIGNLPIHLQAKLLTVIQNRKVVRIGDAVERPLDVRIICATNMDINLMVESGDFREDLLFRINTIEMTLPALNERAGDIPLFAGHFLQRLSHKYKKGIKAFSPKAIKRMEEYSWPGNIRELEHIIERAVIVASGEQIEESDLHFSSKKPKTSSTIPLHLDTAEKLLIEKALSKHEGNISQAALELGLTRAALYRRIEKHSL